MRYSMIVHHGTSVALDPADSTTYWLAPEEGVPTGTQTDRIGIRLPRAVKIQKATFQVVRWGVAPSGESSTFKIRNVDAATEVTLGTLALSAGAAPVHNAGISADNLGFAIAANELWYAQFVTPAWVTNPTQLRFRVTVDVQDNLEEARVVTAEGQIDDIEKAIVDFEDKAGNLQEFIRKWRQRQKNV